MAGKDIIEIVAQDRFIDRLIFKQAGNNARGQIFIKTVRRLCRGFAQGRKDLINSTVNQGLFFAKIKGDLNSTEQQANKQGNGDRNTCLFYRQAIQPLKLLLIKVFVRHPEPQIFTFPNQLKAHYGVVLLKAIVPRP